MKKKILKKIIFLAFLGILVSIYLLNIFYAEGEQGCDISETLSCSAVKNSSYSRFVGVPTALMGIIGYVLIGLIALVRLQKEKWLKNKWMKKIFSQKNLFYVTFVALIFSLYLTYTELFIIKAICIFCIISLLIISLITVYTYKNVRIKIE
ncbi:MAG: vitamin K epoxide reductase family protein [Nanoarchaeota archaeon]|nr:vitamin K epoxide reductase family protein [Nanoarchaeota archaeon]MBU1623248.1 vitamin K epoxide reductase family protein [Nanoarchaeota archaeon]